MTEYPVYPQHIYDLLCRKIAEEFLEHELRKMFPSTRDVGKWKSIDSDVADWFENNKTMAPVRDFWNGFHGIARGFKLTSLVYQLTSENIEWKEEEKDIADLWFVTRGNRGLQIFDQAPSVREVIEYYSKPENEMAKTKLSEQLEDKQILEVIRDHDPIIVTDDGKKGVIVDGNHRVLRSILRGENKIKTYIGRKIADPIIFNSWVPTQIILDVKALAMVENNIDTYAGVIFDLIKNSESAKIEFARRSLNKYRDFDRKIYLAVKHLCDKNRINLPKDEYWS